MVLDLLINLTRKFQYFWKVRASINNTYIPAILSFDTLKAKRAIINCTLNLSVGSTGVLCPVDNKLIRISENPYLIVSFL
jgi:hypothetical protein